MRTHNGQNERKFSGKLGQPKYENVSFLQIRYRKEKFCNLIRYAEAKQVTILNFQN
jgi:hypothetical protein